MVSSNDYLVPPSLLTSRSVDASLKFLNNGIPEKSPGDHSWGQYVPKKTKKTKKSIRLFVSNIINVIFTIPVYDRLGLFPTQPVRI